MAISYDTLELNISADVSKASRGINTLTKNLSNLQTVVKGLDFSLIESLQKHLQKISKIDFSNVSEGLKDVVSAFKSLQSKSLSKTVLSNKTLTPSEMKQDVEADIVEQTPTTQESNDRLKETAEAVKTIKDNIEDLTETAKESKGHIEKIAGAFKRIAFYRVVRRSLQLITQQITQAIQQLAMIDPQFNEAISNILGSVKYLARSIVSMIAPIIKVLTPVFVFVANILSKIADLLGRIFSFVLGQNFAEAQKSAEDYAKSLKKVKDMTLGIDELNVLKQENQDEYFINIDIEGLDKIKDLNSQINDLALGIGLVALLMAVDWKKAIATVVSKLIGLDVATLSVKVNIAGLIGTIAGLVATITSFVDIMKNGLDWQNMTKLVVDLTLAVVGLGLAFKSLNLSLTGGAIGGLIMFTTAIIDMCKNGVNAQNIILGIVGTLTTALTTFFLMLRTKLFDLKMVLGTVGASIGTLVAGFTVFILLFQKVKDTWGNMSVWQKIISALGLTLIAVGTLVATISAFLHQWHLFAIGVAGVVAGASLTGYSLITAQKPSAKQTAQLVGITKFATGGFPEDGFFYANHNELVGQFSNGKTAVANNEQIVEGIKRGVYEAMMMSQDGKENQNAPQIAVYLDSREISKTVEKRLNQRVNNNITGGYKYGN